MLVTMILLTLFGMAAGFGLGWAWRSEVQLNREIKKMGER